MHLNKILEQINGFGRGNQAETNSDFARLAAMGNQNNNTDLKRK